MLMSKNVNNDVTMNPPLTIVKIAFNQLVKDLQELKIHS